MFLNVSFMMLIIFYTSCMVLGCGAIGTKSENNLWFRHDVKVLKKATIGTFSQQPALITITRWGGGGTCRLSLVGNFSSFCR